MKRLRNRTLLMVLLLLAGGAIINVAVAWGCSWWGDPLNFLDEQPVTPPKAWASYMEGLNWRAPSSAIVGNCTTSGMSVLTISNGDASLEICRVGLPWHSLQWQTVSARNSSDARAWIQEGSTAIGWRRGWDFSSANSNGALDVRVLPLAPLGPGFAINTIFYAAILRLLFAAPFALRRRIRARRGQCPACGYPIGTSNVCTECGRTVTPRG